MRIGQPELREKDIQRQVMDYLRVRHIPAMETHGMHHIPGGGMRIIRPFKKGTPDIVGCLPWNGRMFQIEIKDADGRVSPEQRDVMAEYKGAGALVLVARSVEDVVAALDKAR